MDIQVFLDELLKTGKDLANKGQDYAEEKLQIPEEGEGRDAALDGMKKGVLAVGALALLLGTGAGRRLTGSALKIGSLAAIGGIGWKAYQNWVTDKETIDKEVRQMSSKAKIIPINELDEEEAAERSQILLKAMIAAAKADGHVDKKEVALIEEQIEKLGLTGDIADLMREEIAKPLNIKEIASMATTGAIAAEIYLVSSVVTDTENSMEKEYLEALAKKMKLPESLVEQLQKVKEEEVV